MSVLADRGTKLIVQGITGRDGAFHTKQMLDYGTRVVAGVTPGKGGTEVHGVPVFDSVEEAIQETKANASVIYVPARFAADAIYEAADAGLGLIVCITEGIPVNEAMGAYHYVANKRAHNGNGKPRLIGPNCPGLISPGASKVGIVPGHICRPGPIGIVSRSGTLTYEVVHQLTSAALGQSTCIGIGGDPIIGTNFVDALEMFESDAQTQAVVLIGEIGGSDEEEAAQFIKRRMRKPVVAFVAGQTAPPGKRMGHAGAIISGGSGTAAEKMAALQAAGVPVARIPSEIPALIAAALERRRKHGAARKSVKKRAKKAAAKPARQPGKSKARGKAARQPSKPKARGKAARQPSKSKARATAARKRSSAKRPGRAGSRTAARSSRSTASRKRTVAKARGRAKARRR